MELKQEENLYPERPTIKNEVHEELEDLKNNELEGPDQNFDYGIDVLASPKWSWGSMKDSVSFGETLMGTNTALRNHIKQYNYLIDLLQDLTRQLNAETSDLQLAVTSANTVARSANTKAINNEKWINDLWDWQTTGRARVNNLWSWSTTVDNRDKAQDNKIANNATDINTLWDWQTSGRNRLNTLYSWSYGVDTNIANHRTWIDELWAWSDTVVKWQKNVEGIDATQNATLTTHRTWIDELWAWSKGVDTNLSAQRTWIDELWEWSDGVVKWQKNIEGINATQDSSIKQNRVWIDQLWEWSDGVVNWQKGAENTMNLNYIELDTRLKKVEEYGLGDLVDLTATIVAINAVGNKIQKLIEVFDKDSTFMFYLNSYFKTQTDGIVLALGMVNDNFKNYFEDWENGKFWFAFKKFSDFQMAVFLGVFFDTLREDWESNWLDILDVWNVTNGFLNTINGWLEMIEEGIQGVKDNTVIITQWLKQIYEKPIAIIPELILPDLKFDEKSMADAIKEGLKDLNLGKITIGDVVNEAGTNLWDVIKEGVKQAGESFRAILDFINNILDFIVDIIEKILELVIPSNFDFMDEGFNQIKDDFNIKFKVVLDLGKNVQDTLTPTPQDFTQSISFTFMGAEFKPDFTPLDPHIKNFRVVMSLSIWLSVAIYLFRKLTGNGDLINDN